ncbi:MAG: PH domain-containing protein [Anaerolineae bacterium]
MTEWETDKGRGLSIGIGLMVAMILVDVGVIWLAATRPLGIGTFIVGLAALFSLGLLGLFGYWVYGLARSGYVLDRNALVIRWGPTEQIVPTGQIKRVLTGGEVEGHIQFYGGMWPGHCAGYGEVPGVGSTLFYGTVPLRRQIYIVTPGLTYGISPADHEGFLASLHERLQMGPTQIVEQSSKRLGFLNWAIWQDRLGLGLLAAGFLVLLALVGLLCFQFPALPWLLPLHFSAAGNPDRLGPRGQIFIIPFIGLLTLLLNGALGGLTYRRERVASYLLWGGAILIQVLVWTAAIGILGRL